MPYLRDNEWNSPSKGDIWTPNDEFLKVHNLNALRPLYVNNAVKQIESTGSLNIAVFACMPTFEVQSRNAVFTKDGRVTIEIQAKRLLSYFESLRNSFRNAKVNPTIILGDTENILTASTQGTPFSQDEIELEVPLMIRRLERSFPRISIIKSSDYIPEASTFSEGYWEIYESNKSEEKQARIVSIMKRLESFCSPKELYETAVRTATISSMQYAIEGAWLAENGFSTLAIIERENQLTYANRHNFGAKEQLTFTFPFS